MVNLLMLFSHHHKILQGHHHFWLVTACLFYSKLAHALFQAQNGTVEFYKDSIELDRMVFHSDESSRIVHIGPEEVRWPESTLCVCVCVCVCMCVCVRVLCMCLCILLTLVVIFWPYWTLLKTECFCCSVHVIVALVMSNWNTGRKAKHGEAHMKKASVTLTIYKISIKSNWCL